jgi:ABC-type lipoprotein export system ATPase subunit
MNPPFAELSHVTVRGDLGRLVLDEMSVGFERGASTVLIGHNGSGKTTILRLLLGLGHPTSGRVRVGELDLAEASYEQMRAHRLHTGYVFDAGGLWANRTVFQNVALPLTYHSGLSHDDIEVRVRALADELGITDALPLPSYMANASVKKRMLVARALVLEPSLLLCDEPQVGLVRKEALRVHEAFARRQKQREMTLIFADHDGDLGPFTADRRWFVEEGKLRDRPSTLPPSHPVLLRESRRPREPS